MAGAPVADFEAKRYIYAWPESSRLQAALQKNGKNSDRVYTMPGLKINRHFTDRMDDASKQLLGRHAVRPSVKQNMDCVGQLISQGHFRAALNITSQILTSLKQGFEQAGKPSMNTVESFEVWACRFQLLLAVQKYQLLNEEISPFEELDAPDLYFQYRSSYASLGYKGSMIPFSMRLVHAEVLRFTPYPWKSMQRITKLENDTKTVISELTNAGNPEEQLIAWKGRLDAVTRTKARILFFLKEYQTSIGLFHELRNKEDDPKKSEQLTGLLVRMSVHVGDEKGANRYAEEMTPQISGNSYHHHKSYQSVFYGNYQNAQECLLNISKTREENPRIWNNAAVCMLYSGRVKDALNVLCNYKGVPPEPIMINVSTIAELTTRKSEAQREMFDRNVDRMPDLMDPAAMLLVKGS
ncbi:hypothetical protein QR680_012663 [Steinernema hermaphroditum]|uniref:Trafficking protein particle complex subunit 12 n=1 Tax=Steinernema hermaphroditum TaxID=289476 RepID=A0AA39I4C6_9BILA|nr:hypothetical protein QR680_012663 [Steinernema hermaphroditum]